MNEEKKGVGARIKDFARECMRVLRVTKKPNMIEFRGIVKVSGLGILLIGAIGFLIFMANQLIF